MKYLAGSFELLASVSTPLNVREVMAVFLQNMIGRQKPSVPRIDHFMQVFAIDSLLHAPSTASVGASAS